MRLRARDCRFLKKAPQKLFCRVRCEHNATNTNVTVRKGTELLSSFLILCLTLSAHVDDADALSRSYSPRGGKRGAKIMNSGGNRQSGSFYGCSFCVGSSSHHFLHLFRRFFFLDLIIPQQVSKKTDFDVEFRNF